eukprot:NODE_2_length_91304_cov_0.692462.p41 type:complete len:243 gc:universal NODE_2_length_91304_cov_0.692462:44118-44846(+)
MTRDIKNCLPVHSLDNLSMFKSSNILNLAVSNLGYRVGCVDMFLYISSKLFINFEPEQLAIQISTKTFIEGMQFFKNMVQFQFKEDCLILSDENVNFRIPLLLKSEDNIIEHWESSEVILNSIIQPSALLKSIFLVPINEGIVELTVGKTIQFKIQSNLGAKITSSMSNLETFRFQFPKESLTLKYSYKKFANIKNSLKKASKVSLKLNEGGILQWQLLVPSQEQNVYVEFYIQPLFDYENK